MKKYAIAEVTAELKSYESAWDFVNAGFNEIIEKFDNLEEAIKKLKDYISTVRYFNNNKIKFYQATVYSVQEAEYDEDYEEYLLSDGVEVSKLPSMNLSEFGYSSIGPEIVAKFRNRLKKAKRQNPSGKVEKGYILLNDNENYFFVLSNTDEKEIFEYYIAHEDFTINEILESFHNEEITPEELKEFEI